MKTKSKYYLALLCVILLVGAVFYGCKKNDLASTDIHYSLLGTPIKDSIYFKATMAADPNIRKIDSLTEVSHKIIKEGLFLSNKTKKRTMASLISEE